MRQMFSRFKERLTLHKNAIISSIMIFIGIALVILLSGAGITTFGLPSKIKIVLYIVALIYFVSIYVLRVRVSFFVETKQKKKIPIPRPFTFAALSILFFLVVSFLFNENKSENLNTYIVFGLTILLSYLILTSFDSRKILTFFKNTIFVLLLIGIIVFLITYVAKTFFSPFYYFGGKTVYGTYFLLTNDSISGLTNSYFFNLRFTSLFWEPSVLGTMIILAIIAEIYTEHDKLCFVRIAICLLALFLTRSTAGFALLPFVLLLFITEKTFNINLKALAIAIFIFILLLIFVFEEQVFSFLTKIAPDIFDKIGSNKSVSFITRISSFNNCFQVFLKRPLFGFGGVTARSEYFSISGDLIDAETSTFGTALSAFGLAGVIYIVAIYGGIVFCKKIDSFSKIILFITVFLISNVQSQHEILIVNIIYFMPLALTMLPKKAEERNRTIFTKSYESKKTVKDLILVKNDSGEVSRNVIGSLALKGLAIFIAFFTIPVYLKYFDNNSSTYGIWVAITSILSVVTVFDFGMGNGLKNKLIKNISENNDELSKTYISTTYVLTAIIGLSVFAIFSILIFAIDDSVLLTVFFNGQDPNGVNLITFRLGVTIVLLSIGCQFFMKNINYVLQAHQKNAITGIFMVITNGCLMIFALIFASVIPTEYKIISLSIAYFVFLISPLLISSITLYSSKYKAIRPSFKCVDFAQSKSVISSSVKFFVVQIGNLFLWSFNEFLILFVFDYQSAFVTEYTEYYKLFSLMPIMLGTVIQQPFWTAISKADTEGNNKGIKRYILTLSAITLSFILFNLLLSISLSFIFDVWLGTSAPAVTGEKVLAFVLYSIVYSVSLMFVIVMNALTLFKTQMIVAALAILIKIPVISLVVHVLKWQVGWELVLYVNVICYLPIFIFGAFEIWKYLKKKGFSWRSSYEEQK